MKPFILVFLLLLLGIVLRYIGGIAHFNNNVVDYSTQYSITEREALCEQEFNKEMHHTDMQLSLVEEGGNKYYQIELNAINKVLTYWEIMTYPSLRNENEVFAVSQDHPVFLKTLPIEKINGMYSLQHESNFSFSFLSENDLHYFDEKPSVGMFPVLNESIISQAAEKGVLGSIMAIFSRSQHEKNEEYAVDITAPMGTPVIAFDSGTVVWVEGGFGDFGCQKTHYTPKGNSVRIIHSNGLEATYLHLKSESIKVDVGDNVTKGQIIAEVGNSGNAYVPHLHFQLGGMTKFGLRSTPVNFQLQSSNELLEPKLFQKIDNADLANPL